MSGHGCRVTGVGLRVEGRGMDPEAFSGQSIFMVDEGDYDCEQWREEGRMIFGQDDYE